MRINMYVKSDGENWLIARVRHSAHLCSPRLNDLMRNNGWIRWSEVREKFNELKKKVAKSNPTKFPNWKQVEIPMRAAKLNDLPAGIHKEIQLLDQHGQPISAGADSKGADSAKSAHGNSITAGLPSFK